MAPCATLIIWAISICFRPSRKSLTMSWNISPEIWHVIIWTLHFQTDEIRVNLSPFATSDDLPPWIITNLFFQNRTKCICRTIPYRNPFRPLPGTRPYISKWITANTNYFAVNKVIFLSKQNIFQWIGRQCILVDSCSFLCCFGTGNFDKFGWCKLPAPLKLYQWHCARLW